MSTESARYVLDSFAVLAYLGGEAGTPRIKAVLSAAEQGGCRVFLSWINLGEVLYIVERNRGLNQARATLARVQTLPVEMLDVTSQAVLDAAHVKATHRLSYADAFAVVAALGEGAAILTGDPEFESVKEEVVVEWLV